MAASQTRVRVSSCKPISTKCRWKLLAEHLANKIYLDFSSAASRSLSSSRVSVSIRARSWLVICLLALAGRDLNYLNQVSPFLVGIV